MQQRDARPAPQDIFSSRRQLPVRLALNALASTLLEKQGADALFFPCLHILTDFVKNASRRLRLRRRKKVLPSGPFRFALLKQTHKGSRFHITVRPVNKNASHPKHAHFVRSFSMLLEYPKHASYRFLSAYFLYL